MLTASLHAHTFIHRPGPVETFMVRLADGELLEVIAVDRPRQRYLLEDETWAHRRELERPLRYFRLHDMQRASEASARLRVLRRRGVPAAFSSIRAKRRARWLGPVASALTLAGTLAGAAAYLLV